MRKGWIFPIPEVLPPRIVYLATLFCGLIIGVFISRWLAPEKERKAWRTALVAIVNAVLWLLCVRQFYENLLWTVVTVTVSSVCLVIAYIDISRQMIYDRFQLVLLSAGMAGLFLDVSADWISRVVGLAVGFISFAAVGWIVSRYVGTEALGGGDIKLAAASGFLLGWQRLLFMVLFASVSASFVMLLLKRQSMKRAKEEREFPFAPFLTAGLLCSLLFGETIVSRYVSFLHSI